MSLDEEIADLERTLDRGYRRSGRNRQSIDREVYQDRIDSARLNQTLNNILINQDLQQLAEDHSLTGVPDLSFFGPGGMIQDVAGGIGVGALLDRAFFEAYNPPAPVSGATSVAGPEMLPAAAFSGLMQAGVRAAIIAAAEEGSGLPIDYVRGIFRRPGKVDIEGLAPKSSACFVEGTTALLIATPAPSPTQLEELIADEYLVLAESQVDSDRYSSLLVGAGVIVATGFFVADARKHSKRQQPDQARREAFAALDEDSLT